VGENTSSGNTKLHRKEGEGGNRIERSRGSPIEGQRTEEEKNPFRKKKSLRKGRE